MQSIEYLANHRQEVRTTSSGFVVVSNLGRGWSPAYSRTLSVKLVRDGDEVYEIGRKRLRLPAGTMMIIETDHQVIGGIRSRAAGLCLSMPMKGPIPGPTDRQPDWENGFVLRPEDTRLGKVLLNLCDGVLAEAPGEMRRALPEGFETWTAVHLAAITERYAATLPHVGGARAATSADRMNRAGLARAYLAEHRARSVRLEEVAQHVGVSQFQLARTFAAAFGEGPMNFHRRLRLEAARDELRRGYSVVETAGRFGFGSPRAFGRAYTVFFGYPPSEEPRRR